ncbi:MAG: hypothetical protein AABN95_27390 [Acidobacteriota bacterium]
MAVRKLLLILILGTAFTCVAQDSKNVLRNNDVVEMAKAGIHESTIILAIQKGPSSFDTEPAALIELKKQGVSAAVMDAMIRAGTVARPPTQPVTNVHQSNPMDPMPTESRGTSTASYSVVLVDGAVRTNMKYSSPDMRTNSLIGAVVNPFHKSRYKSTINGNHAQLRTKNVSPHFEVGISADANPTDVVALVKLKAKSDRREIETGRASITGGSSGFRKQDLLPITIEEIAGSAPGSYKLYRLKPVNPLPPGEYAVVYGGGVYYDFGVDSN